MCNPDVSTYSLPPAFNEFEPPQTSGLPESQRLPRFPRAGHCASQALGSCVMHAAFVPCHVDSLTKLSLSSEILARFQDGAEKKGTLVSTLLSKQPTGEQL